MAISGFLRTPGSLSAWTQSAPSNIRLAKDLAIRDIRARYAASRLGLLWLVLTPVCLASVYWVVFGQALKVSWVNPETGVKVGFIAPFFAGLTTFLFFNDAVLSSLGVFTSKRNYVRRSPFPIWVLWLSNLLRAGVPALVSVAVLLALAGVMGFLQLSAVLFVPAAIAVIFIVTAAITLPLAMLGPFFGDLQEGARVLFRILFYAAPISYPLSLVSEHWRQFLWLNPLTYLVETLRRASIFGMAPDLTPTLGYLAASLVLLAIGAWLYSKLKGAIADVV